MQEYNLTMVKLYCFMQAFAKFGKSIKRIMQNILTVKDG